MRDIALVYALYPDHASAVQAARAMVERRLAACANILAAGRSVYRWEGEVKDEDEVPVLFKTMADQVQALTAALADAHPYELPAILSWPAAASDAYARWVDAETVR